MQRATGGTNNFYITSFNGRDCGQNYMTAGGDCTTASLAVGFTGPVITPDNLQVRVRLARCGLLGAAWKRQTFCSQWRPSAPACIQLVCARAVQQLAESYVFVWTTSQLLAGPLLRPAASPLQLASEQGMRAERLGCLGVDHCCCWGTADEQPPLG